MKRGSLVTVALQGDFGKARPALVVQSDLHTSHPSMVVLLVTSHLAELPLLRVDVEPTPTNGLEKYSQVQIDKIFTLVVEKVGKAFGELAPQHMQQVDIRLRHFLGLH
ncbi:type II toxin-antitoxin system PemK/MazF family toxin [Paraburkholderia sp. BCC1886]|uniref:type II toxin-antitoxin system PemK/MazF family toxin n=1 Tax=Paraburkholderia sp. BCC1886 TaxID=2562670 RepID=UPI0011827450|nr:type II toxin-antitoxin system PemK/MazF family toxin [Paraburkholderia sp. BCC1886]